MDMMTDIWEALQALGALYLVLAFFGTFYGATAYNQVKNKR